jgi:putative transposase
MPHFLQEVLDLTGLWPGSFTKKGGGCPGLWPGMNPPSLPSCDRVNHEVDYWHDSQANEPYGLRDQMPSCVGAEVPQVDTARRYPTASSGDIREVAANHDMEIDRMEIAEDHVHPFVSFPPWESIARAVGKIKTISASIILREYPGVKGELWGGHFWQVGYFARTVGDAVTAEVIRRYIQYHQTEETTPKQLQLF